MRYVMVDEASGQPAHAAGGAARALCAWFEHERPHPVHCGKARFNASACLVRSRRAGSTLHEKAFGHCLHQHLHGKQRNDVLHSAATALRHRREPCRGRCGRASVVWLVAIIRQQSRFLPYWMAWHLLQVSRALWPFSVTPLASSPSVVFSPVLFFSPSLSALAARARRPAGHEARGALRQQPRPAQPLRRALPP